MKGLGNIALGLCLFILGLGAGWAAHEYHAFYTEVSNEVVSSNSPDVHTHGVCISCCEIPATEEPQVCISTVGYSSCPVTEPTPTPTEEPQVCSTDAPTITPTTEPTRPRPTGSPTNVPSATPTPVPTDTEVPEPTPKVNCNKGGGNGPEGCDPGNNPDKGHDDEEQDHPHKGEPQNHKKSK
jgi:hypothetical protein